MKRYDVYRIIKFILVNLIIILSIATIFLIILDSYNPLVGFLNNEYSFTVLFLTSLSGLALAILCLIEFFKRDSNDK